MSLQTAGAVPGPSSSWSDHGLAAVVAESCATRFSLARGATGAAPCKAPVGGGVGGPRAVRGSCAPAAGAVAPRPMPEPPRDFPRPPLRRESELRHDVIRFSCASTGTGRGLPVHSYPYGPAREAGHKEENRA
jgi:hypothetical protein